MTNIEFSRLLRKIVAESGLPYHEIAKRCGIAHSTILVWANGKVSPKIETAEMVLNELGYEIRVVKKCHSQLD